LIYLLALATTEQPPSCRCRVIQTPPSSDIKIARLRFLFVLRLHTRIDLRDQADLAPARLVTIGSWFSDCIGASSLARRSRIVRVNNHQIGFISTHRKIGQSPSIKWYHDEDMTPMHTTMIGAWNVVEEVQQRFPSQEGGPRLIPVRVPEVQAKSNSSSSPVRSPGEVRNKTDAQVAYKVGFGRSIYGGKQNFIKLPMAPVLCQNSSRVIGNRRNKLISRICQSVALTVWLGLRPKLGAPHPVSYFFSSHRLRNLSLIYLLALATTEQLPSCHRRVIQTPPSSDIKIARLRFLFVL
jgi:hypothetical protein